MDEIKYRFEELNVRDIEESPLNAQIMNDNDFKRLVSNIKKDGCLTSSILVMEQEGKKFMCISGHHRVRASLKAGLKIVPCLIINEVSESTRIRLQLTHNDIHGTSDENIVAILRAKLDEFDINLTAWKNLEIEEFETETIDFEIFKYVSICLKPKSFEELIDIIGSDSSNADEKYFIELDDYKYMEEALTLAFKKGYKSPGKAFRKFLDIVNNHKDEF